MNSGSTCFTVEFDSGLPSKVIWAETFRTARDENWVDFYDGEGQLVSSVRILYVVAIDRVCRPADVPDPDPGPAPAGTGPFPAPHLVPPQPVPPQGAASAGPVEAAARQAARQAPPGVHPVPLGDGHPGPGGR